MTLPETYPFHPKSVNWYIAEHRGLAFQGGACACRHGLVWHDTPNLHCEYGTEHLPPRPCECEEFIEQPRPITRARREPTRTQMKRWDDELCGQSVLLGRAVFLRLGLHADYFDDLMTGVADLLARTTLERDAWKQLAEREAP